MFWSRALSIARRRRGFDDASGPPRREATVISLIRRVKILPRFASACAFLCLMFAHLLWPAMGTSVERSAGAGIIALACKGDRRSWRVDCRRGATRTAGAYDPRSTIAFRRAPAA